MNSPHTASGYYTIYDSETLQADHFNTRLSFGDAAQTLWARTGYLGFVRRTELTAATGGTFTGSSPLSCCAFQMPLVRLAFCNLPLHRGVCVLNYSPSATLEPTHDYIPLQ